MYSILQLLDMYFMKILLPSHIDKSLQFINTDI